METAKKGALEKIRDNIEKIYDDYIVGEEIYLLRDFCHSKPDLYEKNKEAVAGMSDIEEIINFLDAERVRQFEEDNKKEMKDENVARVKALLIKREKEWAEENGKPLPPQEEHKFEMDSYIKDEIKRIMAGSAAIFLFERININPDLWRSVIAAMLLRVPIEKVFECEESILNKYFLPTMDNDYLLIRVNEMTKPSDFKMIADLLEAKQREYAKKHKYINSTSTKGYPSRKEDKIITESYFKGMNIDQIHEELKSHGITKKYSEAKIKERIKKYLTQTRRTEKLSEKIKIAC